MACSMGEQWNEIAECKSADDLPIPSNYPGSDKIFSLDRLVTSHSTRVLLLDDKT